MAVPAHWLGLLSVLVLAVELRLLPPSGVRDPARAPTLAGYAVHLVLPVAVLALSWTGRWTRFVRAALLEALGADYVTTARAAGVGERDVLLRHALPNALIPFVTVVAQSVPVLFSGALVVERVFAYPGMGLLVFESVSGSDHAVAVLVFLVYAALTMLSRLGADVAAGLLDPRIRTAAREAEGAS